MRAARNFLLAGGVVTRTEWRLMEADERAALVLAGETLMQERADLVADAIAERLRPSAADHDEIANALFFRILEEREAA